MVPRYRFNRSRGDVESTKSITKTATWRVDAAQSDLDIALELR
jgi:hypothetical protein